MKKILLVLLAALSLWHTSGIAHAAPQEDPIRQGLWWLYHGRYDRADDLFTRYCQAHPKDPAGYFYKTANSWWELAQRLDFSLPEVEKRFEENYLKTLSTAEALADSSTDNKTRALAYLYWGGAEGLKGRWLVAKKSWVNAYFRGKNGNHLLRKAVELDPELYDAYMGLGIYDYFTDTLPGVQGALAYLFIHGNKARGLKELQRAIDKGGHARVEAMIFLIEIYMAEEKTPEKALPLAEALRKEYPQSPVMHLTEITILRNMQKWPEMTKEAQIFLERSEHEIPYYTTEGVRPARYCLGLGALYGRKDPDLALAYFSQLLNKIDSSRWVTYAYLRRGQIYDLRGDRKDALRDYHTVLSRPNFWGSYEEAQIYMKKPFTYSN